MMRECRFVALLACVLLACGGTKDGASAPPVLTVSVGGVTLAGSGSRADTYYVASGDTVTITSNIPVTWSPGVTESYPRVDVTVMTESTWSASVTGVPNQWFYTFATARDGGAPAAESAVRIQLR